MDIDTALIPFLSTNTPTRTSMALKQITHSLPLEYREAPLVQAGREGKITSENHMYNLMNRRVPSYIKSGVVTAVGKDFIKVKDADDKIHTIQIYNSFPLNGHVELNETPVVEIGTKVKAGTVVAENNFSKDKAIAMGANLRVAFMPHKGMNWKDALVISESAAKKMSAVRFDGISHDIQKHDIMSLKVSPETKGRFEKIKINRDTDCCDSCRSRCGNGNEVVCRSMALPVTHFTTGRRSTVGWVFQMSED